MQVLKQAVQCASAKTMIGGDKSLEMSIPLPLTA
jgi:hypothetical protein